MRLYFLVFLLLGIVQSYGQGSEQITTIDFVQIVDENRDEALFYYQNNWQVLRVQAHEQGYIDSFQLLETPTDEDAPFHLMLITTYLNQEQYDKREEHFGELIEAQGGLNLMNEKKPGEFRKVIFHKENVRHLHEGK